MAKYNGHTSQEARKSQGYNGFKNWNHWNVSLWINNDETLYRIAQEYIAEFETKDAAAKHMHDYLTNSDFMGITHTPDGAPYSVSAIRAAMVGM